MRSDLNDFVTEFLALVGAAVMLVGFVAFVVTSYDEDRANHQVTSMPSATVPAQAAAL